MTFPYGETFLKKLSVARIDQIVKSATTPVDTSDLTSVTETVYTNIKTIMDPIVSGAQAYPSRETVPNMLLLPPRSFIFNEMTNPSKKTIAITVVRMK